MIQRQTEAEQEEELEEPVQAKLFSNKSTLMTVGLQRQIQSLRDDGQPLPISIRNYFEPRFDQDFSHVRVHTNSKESATARALNAKAFTTGQHIIFGAGQFLPGTQAGKKLLAHELTHVIQQQGKGRVENKTDSHFNFADSKGKLQINQNTSKISKGCPSSNISQTTGLVLQRDVDSRYRRLLSVLSISALQQRQRRLDVLLEGLRVGSSEWLDAVERHQAILDEFTNRQLTAPFRGCFIPTNPDMHGRSYNPTHADQDVIAAFHWIDASRASTARHDAHAAGGRSDLSGSPYGPRDAFRHCVWSCFMAQRIGPVRAEQFGTGHENQEPGSPIDRRMDLHNNAMGRSLGTPGANCEAACLEAVRSGRLRTIRGPFTRPLANPPITIPCIGASNQPWP